MCTTLEIQLRKFNTGLVYMKNGKPEDSNATNQIPGTHALQDSIIYSVGIFRFSIGLCPVAVVVAIVNYYLCAGLALSPQCVITRNSS